MGISVCYSTLARAAKCFAVFSLVFVFLFVSMPAMAAAGTGAGGTTDDDAVMKVMCNIIVFTKKLGMPIITGVILGSSIMAIFGKFGWGAIVMLVVFTAVFFGSEQIIGVFVKGVDGAGTGTFDCKTYVTP